MRNMHFMGPSCRKLASGMNTRGSKQPHATHAARALAKIANTGAPHKHQHATSRRDSLQNPLLVRDKLPLVQSGRDNTSGFGSSMHMRQSVKNHERTIRRGKNKNRKTTEQLRGWTANDPPEANCSPLFACYGIEGKKTFLTKVSASCRAFRWKRAGFTSLCIHNPVDTAVVLAIHKAALMPHWARAKCVPEPSEFIRPHKHF